MTPNQKNMLDNLGYERPSKLTAAVEVFAPFIVFVAAFFIVLGVCQGIAHDRAKANCAEIAAYYGIGTPHAMLPPGVTIEYHADRCIRTDNLTEMTGNER